MSNIKDRERFKKMDNTIWKRSSINKKGQTSLPKLLREKLGVNGRDTEILWIQAKRHERKDNEFVIEIAVKKDNV